MIQLFGVTKVYGSTTAVANLSLTVQPGLVTGFLGPNGAGKSTTMRMIVGLDRPTSGDITVNGRRFAQSPAPMCVIGAVLDAKATQPNRTARRHLEIIAATHHIPLTRVDEMLALTGLSVVARHRISAFSLGMNQRLSIAAALLGDPSILMFDEPMNGLDPEGVAWVRTLLRQQAAMGKTVLVSSHLMSEMQHTADHLAILGRGRLLADMPIADFIASASGVASRVNSPDVDQIVATFAGPNVQAIPLGPGQVELRGVDVKQIAENARDKGWTIYELNPVTVSLEDAYLRLTAGAVDYVSGWTAPPPGYAAGPAWPPTYSPPPQSWPAPGVPAQAPAPYQPAPPTAPSGSPLPTTPSQTGAPWS